MYLEVKFKNDILDKVKLSFKRDYVNNKAFLNKDKKIVEEKDVGNIDNKSKSEIYGKFKKLKEIAKNSGDENYLEYELDGVRYELFINDDNLVVRFIDALSSYSYKYVNLTSNKEYFSVYLLSDDDMTEKYRVDIQSNKCDFGECYKFDDDYKKFSELIDSIINGN